MVELTRKSTRGTDPRSTTCSIARPRSLLRDGLESKKKDVTESSGTVSKSSELLPMDKIRGWRKAVKGLEEEVLLCWPQLPIRQCRDIPIFFKSSLLIPFVSLLLLSRKPKTLRKRSLTSMDTNRLTQHHQLLTSSSTNVSLLKTSLQFHQN